MLKKIQICRLSSQYKKSDVIQCLVRSVITQYPLLKQLFKANYIEAYASKAFTFQASISSVARQLKRSRVSRIFDEQIIITSTNNDCPIEHVSSGVLELASMTQFRGSIPQLWIPSDEKTGSNIAVILAIRYPDTRCVLSGSVLIEEVILGNRQSLFTLKRRFGI
jgi:hypothetical protein